MEIQGLQKMTLLDYPGKVACTVFLGGCDLRCPFCHNRELVEGEAPAALDDGELTAFLKKRQGLLDGTLRIRHNGIDIFIDCMETKDMLVIPMTRAEGARRDPRMERMTQDPDDGQGPYKGFLLIVCEECGAVKAFCAKRETYSFRCDECGYEPPLENLRPMYMHCKCGESFRYRTNAKSETITHTCLRCKAPVDMELNRRGTAYVTVGMKGGRRK